MAWAKRLCRGLKMLGKLRRSEQICVEKGSMIVGYCTVIELAKLPKSLW